MEADFTGAEVATKGTAVLLAEADCPMALGSTELARATQRTIRLTLLKVGAVVLSNTLQMRLLLSRPHPDQVLFRRVAATLAGQP